MKTLAATFSLMMLAGCATSSAYDKQYAKYTAGNVPCTSNQITTERTSNAGDEWVATCNGDKYVCTRTCTGIGLQARCETKCSEMGK